MELENRSGCAFEWQRKKSDDTWILIAYSEFEETIDIISSIINKLLNDNTFLQYEYGVTLHPIYTENGKVSVNICGNLKDSVDVARQELMRFVETPSILNDMINVRKAKKIHVFVDVSNTSIGFNKSSSTK